MNRQSKILITGSSGMVGSAITSFLGRNNFKNLLTPNRKTLNLLEKASVFSFFDKHKPEYVFMVAAKVGGISANKANPVGFLLENSQMQANLFEACHKYQTKKNLFLGSSCIYPRLCDQPMKEEFLLTSPLEPTNEGYALAKIMGIKLAKFYFEQFHKVTVCPMPCNIYGTNDHYDLSRCHVLTALIKRFVDAFDENRESVTLWGTGKARREFIHVDDVAASCFFLMQKVHTPEIINVGTGVDLSIRELAFKIAKRVGYHGHIRWDESKPDGMPRKCLDIRKLKNLGFEAKVSLDNGIDRTIREYREIKSKS